MRVSRMEMDRSHARIVEGAARLFRRLGVANTGVADVMEAAGLTHGGFYRHFESKDALLASAIQAAFAQVRALVDDGMRGKHPDKALSDYHAFYLSEAHLGDPSTACPVATLAGEVARASPPLKEEFGRGVRQMLEMMASHWPGAKRAREVAATREFAMLVGAAVIARATDPDTAKSVLAACRPVR